MPRSSHTETLEAFVILSEAKDLSRTIHRRNETVEILQRTLSVRFRMTRADAWWICIKGGLGGGAMGVKPELAFDVCWEIYRGAREVLETKRGVSALNWKDTGKFLWRPDFRPRLNEWVADFALAGKSALEGPDWASRMVLFRLYYLGLAPYENARYFLGLSEHSWVNWTEQIRHRCGKELLGRRMFPPRKYFTHTE